MKRFNWLYSLFLFFLAGTMAFGAHNVVTVSNVALSGNTFTGRATVQNGVGSNQDGVLTVTVFEVLTTGVVRQLAFKDLGGVSFPPGSSGTSKSVDFSVNVQTATQGFMLIFGKTIPLQGNFVVLANFESSVGTNKIAHRHSASIVVAAAP